MTNKRALILVDIQNDFCERGSLAVPGAKEILPVVNELRSRCQWDLIALSADWHPKDHWSFASNHSGAELFSAIKLKGGVEQVMWPDHCVQGTAGSEFHKDLVQDEEHDVVIRKGTHTEVDSYSAFFDNNKEHKTALDETLKRHGINEVYICGLALDYCVNYTLVDAAELGYKTFLVEDASRGIAEASIQAAKQRMKDAGVKIVQSKDIH